MAIMSTVVIGLNVSCGSESRPGLDDNRWDWLRLSFKFPETAEIVYLNIALKGDFDNAGPDHGDTNRVIAARINTAVAEAKAAGKLPQHAPILVEISPDPAKFATSPARVVVHNAEEVNMGCTSGKLKLDIFDPYPEDDPHKRRRVRVVTPTTPPPRPPEGKKDPPPPLSTPPVLTPRGGVSWGASLSSDEEGFARRFHDSPWGNAEAGPNVFPSLKDIPGQGKSAPERRRYGGGGWLPAGYVVFRHGDPPKHVEGFMSPEVHVPFPYVYDSATAQAQAIADAIRHGGVRAEVRGPDVFVAGPARPTELRFMGVSTGWNPRGISRPLPWDFALLADDRSGRSSRWIPGIRAQSGRSPVHGRSV